MAKSAVSCGFVHIYWRNPSWKTSCFCAVSKPLKVFFLKKIKSFLVKGIYLKFVQKFKRILSKVEGHNLSKSLSVSQQSWSLKVRLSPSKKNCFICFNESPSKVMENAFFVRKKALFVLKIFLSWLFGHVEKTAWLELEG